MINPNEAPKGYRAIEGKCKDCGFSSVECTDKCCTREEGRGDHEDVIFEKIVPEKDIIS